MGKKLLVPFDGSASSVEAIHFALTMVKEEDELLLINVQKPQYDEYQQVGNISKEQLDEFYFRQGESTLETAFDIVNQENVKCKKIVRVGLPAVEITKTAKELSIHSIIMGSRGMSPVVSNALGSVTYSVLHLSPCPVTILPFKE